MRFLPKPIRARPAAVIALVCALLAVASEYVGTWGVHFWPLRPLTTGFLTLVVAVLAVDAEIRRRDEEKMDWVIAQSLRVVRNWTRDLRTDLDDLELQYDGTEKEKHAMRLGAVRDYEAMLASMLPALVSRSDARHVVGLAQLMTLVLREVADGESSLGFFDVVPQGKGLKSETQERIDFYKDYAKFLYDEVTSECARVSKLLGESPIEIPAEADRKT